MARLLARQRSATDYTVACICPMGVELAPVEAMLDEIHDPLPTSRDQNAYTLGQIGAHNVVIAVMPGTGTNAAATVGTQLYNDFPSIRFSLLVGIGGGVPGAVDVRLGDVVVSQATDTFGGVVQYDLGKRGNGGQFQRTGLLNKPPEVLSANVRKLDGQHRRQGHKLSLYLSEMVDKYPRMQDDYSFPTMADDDLFLTSYSHQPGMTCQRCDRQYTLKRLSRPRNEPYIHYGTIGSANVVVKDAVLRDELHKDMNVLCVEMEAAGLMNNFPCLVIRGICDYADSHKNKQWQPYAAAVAAAYMKELLLIIPARQVEQIQNAVDTTNGPVESYNIHFHVPHLLSPVFTGRDVICQHLDESLILSSTPRLPVQRRFVLFGLGGSGKTQICVRYAQTYRPRYWAIFWIDASTPDSIQQSVVQVALLLRTESNIKSVKSALTHATQPWLLVFDNADDPELSLNEYFPTGDRGDLVITSRNPGCRHYNTVDFHEVGPMLPSDSRALLLSIVYGDSNPPQSDQDHSQNVVEALGHLALAVTQAGAYIREMSCTFDYYIELYQRRRPEALQYFPRHSGTDYRHTVFTTWQVSLDRIESIQTPTSTFALNMLRLLSFYHHDRVPLAMFYQAWRHSAQNSQATLWAPWPTSILNDFDLKHLVQASVALLSSFSLIGTNTDASLSLHPLICDWCQTRLDAHERRSGCRQAITLLATSVRWDFKTEDYRYRQSLTPHVYACLRLYDLVYSRRDDDIDACDWSVFSLILSESGFTRDALRLQEQAVQLLKSELGEDHPNTIASMHDLANRYSETGRQGEALQLAEQVVQLQKIKLGEDHPNTILSMHNLAIRYSEAGRRGEALQLAEQVVQLQKTKLGEDHPDTFMSMHSLAIMYSEGGRRSEALQLAEQVVQLRKIKLGEDHPDTIASMHNLAIRYNEAGRRGEALQLSEQVVQLRKTRLGEDHPDTIASMHNLANRYSEAGRRGEALQLVEQVVQLQKIKLGEDHPNTIMSMHNLAINYSNAGRRGEALQLVEQVVQLRKIKLGEDHPDTIDSMHNLAINYSNAGRRGEALQLVEQVVQLRKIKLGEDHPDTIDSMYNLAIFYNEAERGGEALQLAEQVVQLSKIKLGENHPDTLKSIGLLAFLSDQTGDSS